MIGASLGTAPVRVTADSSAEARGCRRAGSAAPALSVPRSLHPTTATRLSCDDVSHAFKGAQILKLIATSRLVIALLVIAAVTATTLDTASRVPINPLNFFGYVTIQSNLFAAAVFIISAIGGFRGRRPSKALQLARGCATTYLILVGIVYNTLLAGVADGVELEWANTVPHIVTPIYVTIDRVLFGDHRPLPWKRFWVILISPTVWLVVVLIRGATDGWVPYPFLDPATGYGSVALYGVLIALGFAAFGVISWALSRVRVVKA